MNKLKVPSNAHIIHYCLAHLLVALNKYLSALNKLRMVPGGVSDQVPVSDQPIRKKDAQAMFAV